MSKKQYLLVYFASLTFFGAVSLLQKTPGYMDAAYYYSVGQQIATGKGFFEPFIWNYLSSPTILPAPAFTYWMPFAGILSALGMFCFRSTTYLAARVPFILLSAFIPLFNIYFSSLFSHKKAVHILAGVIGITSGYYLPYLTITETFVPFFVLGAIFFILSDKLIREKQSGLQQRTFRLLLGCTAGLMHLTRADGFFWLVGSWIIIFLLSNNEKNSLRSKVPLFGLSLLGYLVVMSPWYIRNLTQFKSLFPPGSNLAIYFTNYNDLFNFPVTQINAFHLFQSGISQILIVRLNAGLSNLESLIGTVGEILLFPFMAAGIWYLRKEKLVQFSLVMLSLTFIVMSFVFPFAGQRGGFFHSATALQCFFWGITPIGFEYLITKLAVFRKWEPARSLRLLGGTLIVGLFIFSAILFVNKVFTSSTTQKYTWDENSQNYKVLDRFLLQSGANSDQIVMVNDSPGYYAATGRAAIQMTSGSIESDIAAMKQFGATYLLIDDNHSSQLDPFFQNPVNYNSLIIYAKFKDFVIYKLGN
jgi:hypothetical protein